MNNQNVLVSLIELSIKVKTTRPLSLLKKATVSIFISKVLTCDIANAKYRKITWPWQKLKVGEEQGGRQTVSTRQPRGL